MRARYSLLVPVGLYVMVAASSLVAVGCTTRATRASSGQSVSHEAAEANATGEAVQTITVRVHAVPCASVSTTWPVFDGQSPKLSAPALSVVRTNFRPKDVRLFLDERFIGRARYFNGKKGYLFLEPGRYRLECRMGGYAIEVFEIEARANCRFDIRHRMERSSETGLETKGDPPGKGIPTQRVFPPVTSGASPRSTGASGGPDTTLRPDVDASPPREALGTDRQGSLRLRIRPLRASVFLDGGFLATGEELDLMVEPLAVAAGPHRLEVQAPGFTIQVLQIEIGADESREIDITLERASNP